MIRFTLEEIKKATNAYCDTNKQGSFEISTDTRTIKSGDLYLPLKGASFDGENFCQKALDNGAIGCFYTKEKPCNFAIKVDDTLKTYLELASFALQKYNPKVIGVTGSSGKTTTKEMIYSVVSEKFRTQKTFSNHNNEIGFCQTILGMNEDTQVVIVEMGMRGLGEIELITKYAKPDLAVITNAGSAHIGRLGSLDNIAKAKCEITSALKETLIANDNERLRKFANFDGEKIFYSIKDVEILEKRSGYSKFIYSGKEYELNIEGDYNIENSLSAIEVGYKLGMSYDEIRKGLLKYKPIEKRWEAEKIGKFNVINDSYNANPESMKASVATFLELYKNPVVILGNMGELGENEEEFHREVGNFLGKKFSAKAINVKFLVVGNLAKKIGEELENSGFDVKYFGNNIETSRYILDNINEGSTIFLKASRAMKFEEIITNIKEEIINS
jgi:UDP-N-acetylmuramoyl-tripeptide--D-alanyl-D-alanine ligase